MAQYLRVLSGGKVAVFGAHVGRGRREAEGEEAECITTIEREAKVA